jgi:probable HAF family extracellular repeat protein
VSLATPPPPAAASAGLGAEVFAGSGAYDINDRGQVVGWSDTTRHAQHAFLWEAGTGMQDLGTLDSLRGDTNSIHPVGRIGSRCARAVDDRPACLGRPAGRWPGAW